MDDKTKKSKRPVAGKGKSRELVAKGISQVKKPSSTAITPTDPISIFGIRLGPFDLTYKYLIFDPRVTDAILRELEADMRFMLAQKKIARVVEARALGTSRFTAEIEQKHPELVKDLL